MIHARADRHARPNAPTTITDAAAEPHQHTGAASRQAGGTCTAARPRYSTVVKPYSFSLSFTTLVC
eukprot:1900729-Prymnesium_polylepis.2